ncbi:hypothetical protein IMCC21906_01543 [Spongiibacter sp. IMCC21906]|uniref:protein adenylyltransferase SelO n=1 Tax=Spongiibacter sp. IMCC21906 TaxID=1620392 RepID=UPI00062DEEE2|nr:YdiU family protein [Spongiibacter sp. IMCC21906]AKH69221.1 hypothetical protein IMCC21906_01543 [Spongiibacter sp. IMCC21906]
MTPAKKLSFDNSYARLPEGFYSRQLPATTPQPGLIRVNRDLATALNIDADWLASDDGLAMLAGNQMPEGADPIATVYAGHQFGSFNPQLGDGRAILIGEVLDQQGQRFDIQLKGAGRTPYSRGGDGKSPLGPVIREYIVSEAMFAMGVPTTRALAAVTTGEQVYRDQVLPGAILTRVAKSHIRIGSLQFFAAKGQTDAVETLLNHLIQRHFPDAESADIPALAVFTEVMHRQAELIAQWQSLGFIHGVMNTDNMLLSGETIDYGPCAFMEEYHPGKVFSSIDAQGRYAFGNQPAIAQWNLAQLAQCLLPLLDENMEMAVEMAQQVLNEFPDIFFSAYRQRMAAKLGLTSCDEDDEKLYQDFLALLEQEKCDFTLAFRRLSELSHSSGEIESIADIFTFSDTFSPWLARWQTRQQQDPLQPSQAQQQMLAANPVFIPRNHLVEEAIQTATQDGNFDRFHQLLTVLEQPFHYHSQWQDYARPAKPEERVLQTFCGT